MEEDTMGDSSTGVDKTTPDWAALRRLAEAAPTQPAWKMTDWGRPLALDGARLQCVVWSGADVVAYCPPYIASWLLVAQPTTMVKLLAERDEAVSEAARLREAFADTSSVIAVVVSGLRQNGYDDWARRVENCMRQIRDTLSVKEPGR